jgi:hypothetical protein
LFFIADPSLNMLPPCIRVFAGISPLLTSLYFAERLPVRF